MSIRIRVVDETTIALCANNTTPKLGDHYLDDNEHYALAAKFSRDWGNGPSYEEEWALMTAEGDAAHQKDAD